MCSVFFEGRNKKLKKLSPIFGDRYCEVIQNLQKMSLKKLFFKYFHYCHFWCLLPVKILLKTSNNFFLNTGYEVLTWKFIQLQIASTVIF